ncbi:MAG: SMP-30/gluconolactonase/LRE family protein [Steroidobacteraceae bacterium]|jgi:sugar lactone lactonase YvrE|nr:SMP-30/gluconolactonase/LRE family protein [Steroidobacteraceae bacterium]
MSQPFAPGDLLVAATDVDDRNVDLRNHSGPGRILHYGADFAPKGELRTGQDGLVVGLAIDPADRSLYACDPGSQTVTRFDREGRCGGRAALLPRARIGSMLFLPDGRFVAGLHSRIGEPPGSPAPRLWIGDFRRGTLEALEAEVDGGKFGFHCITHFALAPDGRTLLYVSEAGRRLMRVDLEARRQLPDLLQFGKDDPRGTYGPAVLRDGRVLLATGGGALMLDPDGSLLRSYEFGSARGWSRLTLSLDQRVFHVGNFVEGRLETRDVETGELRHVLDIQRKYCLSGVAEVPDR